MATDPPFYNLGRVVKLIEPTVTFEETPDAFEELTNGARGDVKILTATGQEPPRPIHDEVRGQDVRASGSV